MGWQQVEQGKKMRGVAMEDRREGVRKGKKSKKVRRDDE